MTTENLQNIMKTAWQFRKQYNLSMSEALKQAWANFKLKKELSERVVMFYFRKVNGEIRQAYGTLMANIVPATAGNRKTNNENQIYFDTEKLGWRSFKKVNLISIA